MKKRLALLWTLLLALCLTACAGAGTAPSDSGLVDLPTVSAENAPKTDPLPEADPPERAVPSEDAVPSEAAAPEDSAPDPEPTQELLPEDGSYTAKEDVALYLLQYGHLPDNFITKKEARALGWPGGSLEPYAPGKCIGGDRFGNYEGLLPEADGRTYTECDIDTLGAGSRGAKRLVFSNDGLIYYTGDHYESFTLLYGEE